MAQAYTADFERSSAQYASITNDLGITNGAITISAWFNIESSPGSGETYAIAQKGDAGTQVYYRVAYFNNAGTPQMYFRRGREWINGTSITYNVTFSVDTWHHVVCRYDGDAMEMFVDGVSVASATGVTGDGTMTLSDHFLVAVIDTTGSSTLTPTTAHCFDGKIDDVIVFNADIGDTRSAALYNTPCNPDLTNAVARYTMDAQDFTDDVGAFDMTGSGTPTFQNASLPYSCAGAAGPKQGTRLCLTGVGT